MLILRTNGQENPFPSDLLDQVSAPTSSYKLLIVDDEPTVIQVLQKIFVPHYIVETATSGKEALEKLHNGFSPQVILADQRMPQMSGAEFFAKTREIVPHAIRILLTGYSDIRDLTDSINLGKVYSYLTKPWNNDDLRESVRLAFEYYNLSEEKAALAHALEDISALHAEKTEIMNIVSHDLKNPIGAIMGLSELIINAEEFQLTQEEYLRFGLEINNISVRMLRLLTNLLDLNATETGGINVHPVQFHPTSILNNICQEYTAPAAEKDIDIHFFGNEHLTVLADEIRFYQVMDNLLSNAVKYSPHGKNIFVDVVQHENFVRFSIRDEGPGIDAEDMKKMFGKFARLSAQPTGGEHSSGLGLSIVKKLVEAMNGKVWCESEFGKGATFIVELPSA